MKPERIARLLGSVSSAAGVAHSSEIAVWHDRAEVVLHNRLPEAARRKMRKKWRELVASEKKPPTLRIKTHKCATH